MLTGCRDYQLSRRAFMGASSATLLGMSVKGLLAASGKDHEAQAEHVILFWTGGGMSHIDTWDPKPGRPTGGDLSSIKTSAPGVEISEIFPGCRRTNPLDASLLNRRPAYSSAAWSSRSGARRNSPIRMSSIFRPVTAIRARHTG